MVCEKKKKPRNREIREPEDDMGSSKMMKP